MVDKKPGETGVDRARDIRKFLVDNIESHPRDLVRLAAEEFGVTRQAVNRQIGRLIDQHVIVPTGKTKSRRYELASAKYHRDFVVSDKFDEHLLFKDFVEPLIADCPENVQYICHYGITEMLNNVKDHSGSSVGTITVDRTAKKLSFRVYDVGVGIFRKIRDEKGLENTKDAVFQLSKGKFTTDPTRHSGEGIFFTSRMFDHFAILSGTLWFAHQREEYDWLLEDRKEREQGTMVLMEIDPVSKHTTQEVFDHYSVAQDDAGFKKTHVGIELASDDRLVSRSQAKRVTAGLHQFQQAILDFRGVETIGPAFADEIFRVYQMEHPEVSLQVTNTNAAIDRMIAKALSDLETTRKTLREATDKTNQ